MSLSQKRVVYGLILALGLVGATQAAVAAEQSAPSHSSDTAPALMIEKGDGYPVCRALLSSLMSIDPPRPLQSHMPLGRNPRGLSVPDWQPVNVQEHLDDIRLLFTERFHHSGQRLSEVATMHEIDIKWLIDADLSTGQVRLEHTDIDIDNDGYVDSVYRYYAPYINTSPPHDFQSSGWQLLIYSGNPDADRERTAGNTFGSGFGGPQYWDVYRYYGKAYVTQLIGDAILMYKTSFSHWNYSPTTNDFCVISERKR